MGLLEVSALQSEKVVISSPLSFDGSARRIWKITHTDNALVKWVLLIPVALMIVSMAWMFVLCWYMVMYGLFGLLFIPFRLMRRSSRKQKRDKLQHRELLQAIQHSKQ